MYEFGRVMEILEKSGHVTESTFYLELNEEETDEVLKATTTNIRSQQNSVVADHQYTFMEEDRLSPSVTAKDGFQGPCC